MTGPRHSPTLAPQSPSTPGSNSTSRCSRRWGSAEKPRACSEALARGDLGGWVGAITDEMVETFVILGPVDECRKRVADVWDVADSFCLVPPIGGLAPEKVAAYAGRIAETFYG